MLFRFRSPRDLAHVIFPLSFYKGPFKHSHDLDSACKPQVTATARARPPIQVKETLTPMNKPIPSHHNPNRTSIEIEPPNRLHHQRRGTTTIRHHWVTSSCRVIHPSSIGVDDQTGTTTSATATMGENTNLIKYSLVVMLTGQQLHRTCQSWSVHQSYVLFVLNWYIYAIITRTI